jgi:UDP-arabinose 4-epimerase
MRHVVVTGGAGYIGSHVCKALSTAGFQPVAYDDLSTGHEWAVRWGRLEHGRIQDLDRLTGVLRVYKPVAVIHLAASAYVGESVVDPAKYYLNNVAGSQVLLDAMHASSIGHLVFSSTCATYGTPDEVPIREEAAQRPINPYGRSKLIVEGMITDYAKAYGMHALSLRYFNACGADPAGEIGENHDPEPHLVPRALMAATGLISGLDILGTDYDTLDGTAVRDYIHVTDLADAHVRALKYLLDGGARRAFNLGTGRGLSVRDIVRAVERNTGWRVPVRMMPRRPGDPAVLIADAGTAGAELDWHPEYSHIDTIVATAWRWHCSHHVGFPGQRAKAI